MLLPRLLRFCDFLENRVRTSNLLLLRRILREFSAGHEHTLAEFMRLGASVVAVLPVELKSQRRRHKAARLLALTANENSSESEPSKPCVFRFLLARVATKNILWMRDMFQDFCRGEDKLLQEFLRRGDESISVVPVDIRALGMMPLPPPPLVQQSSTEESTTMLALTATPPEKKRPRSQPTQDQENAVGTSNATSIKKARTTTTKKKSDKDESAQSLTPEEVAAADEDLRRRIIGALAHIEARKPWLTAFSPEALPCPFSRSEHPELAAALDSFWEEHSHAVWERQFWAPLSRKRCRDRHNERRIRQAKAQQAFESTVMIPAYEQLGAAFFVELDELPSPHRGWWYLSNVEDLFTMARGKGLPACVQYMEAQSFERYPKSPGGGRRFFSMRNEDSSSMWASSSSTLGTALREIRDLKANKVPRE